MTAPDFPRRSSSLHPRSPEPGAGAPLSSKNNDTSVQQPEKGLGKESQGGNEEGVGGDGGGNGSGSGKNEMDDAKEKIEAFDWEGLEGRFWDRMEECRKVEEGVREEFEELVEVGWVFLLSLLVFGVFTRVFFRWEWGGFAWDFGLMDGSRSSMRGRLLGRWARRTELRSGTFHSVLLGTGPPSRYLRGSDRNIDYG